MLRVRLVGTEKEYEVGHPLKSNHGEKEAVLCGRSEGRGISTAARGGRPG